VSTGSVVSPKSQISLEYSELFSSCSKDIDARAFGAEAISDPMGFQSSIKRRIKRSAKRNIRLGRGGIKCVKKNDIEMVEIRIGE
jgi:hypothetical protein